MKNIFFLLLLLPSLTFAQSNKSITAFLTSRPDTLGTPVLELNNKKFNQLYSIREVGMKRKYIYTIYTAEEYRKVFDNYHKDSLPFFDFSKQELVVYTACGQCMIVCNHHGREREPCHRNACVYQEAWYIRDKK